MKKRLLFPTFLSIFCLQSTLAQMPPSLPANQLTLSTGNHTLPLRWNGDTLAGQWNPHAALLIPVTIAGCPHTFYMQFDTGSPYTLFYGNKLQAIYRKYPATTALRNVGDSLSSFRFKAGPLSITARQVAVRTFDSTTIDWKNNRTPIIIGTLGTDLIDNKVAVINYPQQQLHISDSLPAAFRKGSATGFHFSMRRILLPAEVSGKKTILYFDSGSSAFELLTDKATCSRLAADTLLTVRYPVQSWGKTLIANTITTTDSITLAGHTVPLRHATWIEGVSDTQVNQMMKMGIGGMTGNKLFISSILVLDTRNKQFKLF
ncbi:MAG: hypothetical protein J7621_09485 [Niastella sp.]|nr:hypothetical protein [Niastella sp.]